MLNKNIVLIGMPGCGKTTIGKILAEKLKIEFCDVDKYIEKTQGKSIPDIFKNGEDYFRKIESEAVEEISSLWPKIISTGGGVVKNFHNIKLLKKNGIIVFINRPLEKIISDVDTQSRPLLKDGKEKLYKLFEERYFLYKEYCDFEALNEGRVEKTLEKIESIISLYF
jgi:shikimate kinase